MLFIRSNELNELLNLRGENSIDKIRHQEEIQLNESMVKPNNYTIPSLDSNLEKIRKDECFVLQKAFSTLSWFGTNSTKYWQVILVISWIYPVPVAFLKVSLGIPDPETCHHPGGEEPASWGKGGVVPGSSKSLFILKLIFIKPFWRVKLQISQKHEGSMVCMVHLPAKLTIHISHSWIGKCIRQPWTLWDMPSMKINRKGKIVFQPSIFRVDVLVSGRN